MHKCNEVLVYKDTAAEGMETGFRTCINTAWIIHDLCVLGLPSEIDQPCHTKLGILGSLNHTFSFIQLSIFSLHSIKTARIKEISWIIM